MGLAGGLATNGYLSSGSSGAGATVTQAGNLGATPSVSVSGQQTTRLVGTLTANCTWTITGLAAGTVVLIDVTQDGTGGRTLSVTAGGSTVALPVNTAALAGSLFELFSPDGASAHVAALGSGPASSTALGTVQLTGDLGGTSASPTVPGLAAKADLVTGSVPLAQLASLVDSNGLLLAASVPIRPDWQKPTAALFEAFPRRFAQSSFTPGTGVLWVSAISLPKGLVVTSVNVLPTTTGSGTHGWGALYDNSGASGGPGAFLRQSTDDASVAWTANTVKTFTLSSTFTTTYAGFHYIGFMVVSGTMPTIASDGASIGTANQLPPLLSATGQGALTTTATTPVSSIGAQSKQFYAYVA